MVNRNAARDGLLDFGADDFDATCVHVLVLSQPGQKLAFAAAQVENTRIWFDDVADDGVIAAPQQRANEGLSHARRRRLLWSILHTPERAGQKTADQLRLLGYRHQERVVAVGGR